ncbi:MAG: hypothetical protein IH840_12070 [Candidatus Heimdallarchaeota archaeon]|nr:hypothetical protein [Candidatus Heimdallarchaeota archaeon]
MKNEVINMLNPDGYLDLINLTRISDRSGGQLDYPFQIYSVAILYNLNDIPKFTEIWIESVN